jgi:3-oxoacyl-[acyl-carrier protein] reductase
VRRIAAAALERFETIDILVNNAAVRPQQSFLEMSDDDWRRVLDVDLNASAGFARAFLPGMCAKGWGRIVNFTGMNAIMGTGGRAHVSAAKHGVWGLTKALAKEFGGKGVTANAISPGPIAGDREEWTGDHARQSAARIPLGRMGTPAEIAAVCGLLCSDEGGYISGQMIAVNGAGTT